MRMYWVPSGVTPTIVARSVFFSTPALLFFTGIVRDAEVVEPGVGAFFIIAFSLVVADASRTLPFVTCLVGSVRVFFGVDVSI